MDTALTRLFDLTVPVIAAPMAGVADAQLAVAAGRAGGLGCIGIGPTRTADWIARQLASAADAGVPFGVGLMAWSIPADPTAFELTMEARPALMSISLGELDPWVGRASRAGIVVAVQVATRQEAVAAEGAGASIVVARGGEAGGHGRNAVATLPLLQDVLDAVSVPVLAAGGISGARGLAAVLAAGAAGAWVGTAFAGCQEATSSASARKALSRASATDTVYGRSFDIAQRLAWPERFGGRALANDFTAAWSGREDELTRQVAGQDADRGITAEMVRARSAGDARTAPVYCGQGVGAIEVDLQVADVMREFRGAGRLLDAAAKG
jgi:nitronate monooxygenase